MRKTALLSTVFLSFVMALISVSALYDCQPQQTIFKLSSLENAHAEVYSSNQYSVDICYNELFGIDYTQSNPHLCVGNNIVVKLSQSTNAHLAGPATNIFINDVCYGDLTCSLRSGVCQGNEVQVVTFMHPTNSHVSTTNSFPFRLCCSSNFAINSQTSTSPTNTTNTTSPGNTTNTTGTGTMVLIINSPSAGQTYNSSAFLSISSFNTTTVLYNYGTGNFTYLTPINLNLANGSYVLNVFALNSTSLLQQSISFSITNTTNTTSPGNTTNTTGTGTMGFTVYSPLFNSTYNSSILLNISSFNTTTVLYNYGTGNFTYLTPINLNLANGSYSLTVYVQNSTTILQQSILFNIVNSSSSGNVPNNGSSNGGSGGSGGSSSSSSNNGNDIIYTYSENTGKENKKIKSNDPIILSDKGSNSSAFNFNIIQSLLIILIVIFFIVVAQYIINRHNQSKNKRP